MRNTPRCPHNLPPDGSRLKPSVVARPAPRDYNARFSPPRPPRLLREVKRLADPNRDPLEDSKMSFGEHLEELRTALWKAVIALVCGFLVGLLVGDDFIHFVTSPLEAGLAELEQETKKEGLESSDEQQTPSEQSYLDEGLVPERYTLDPQRLIDALEALGAQVAPSEKLPDRLDLWLWTPPRDKRVIATGVPTGFSVYVRASLVVGAVLASPFILYFLWSFVAAGLYPHEKRYVHVFMPMSVGLFLLGATVAFYIVLYYVIRFLLGFSAWLGIEVTPRIDEWIGFVLLLPLMFGVAFQLPLVMLFLERIGVASTAIYLKYWRYAVLVIFVVSMILTPADPQSLLWMAGSLTPLYFLGLLLCKYLPKGAQRPFSEPAP